MLLYRLRDLLCIAKLRYLRYDSHKLYYSTMEDNWPDRYAAWKDAYEDGNRAKAHEILQDARRSIPNSSDPNRWDWFILALENSESAGFVMAVFSNHSIPNTLMDPVLSAGIRFGNASTISMFVIPCIESFGLDKVKRWLAECGDSEKSRMAEYWFPRTRKRRN